MPDPSALDDQSMAHAGAIGKVLRGAGLTAAAAESLTSGAIASHLGAAEAASDWFAGAVVAYSKLVKFEVLGVEPGPVVTGRCARQMARGAAQLTHADFAVAVTGVGGPDEEEGQPVGTVYIGLHGPDGDSVEEHHFDGDVPDVLRATVRAALRMLEAGVRASATANE
jgi:nicotinamide-nucleotide amidase